jgi:hypothetical protein
MPWPQRITATTAAAEVLGYEELRNDAYYDPRQSTMKERRKATTRTTNTRSDASTTTKK